MLVDYYWCSARSPSMGASLIFINTFRIRVFLMLFGSLVVKSKDLSDMFENGYKRIFIPFVVFLPILAQAMSVLNVIAQRMMATGQIGFDLVWLRTRNNLGQTLSTQSLRLLYYLSFHIYALLIFVKLWQRRPASVCNRLSSRLTDTPIYASFRFIFVCLGLPRIGNSSSAGHISANLSLLQILVFSFILDFAFCLAGFVTAYWKL